MSAPFPPPESTIEVTHRLAQARMIAEFRSNPTRPILVVGAGIGGLAAAVALHRVGIDVRVLERATDLHEVGAGLGLWANAVRVLDRLGIGEEIRRIGAPLTRAEICSSDGVMLNRIDLQAVSPGSDSANYVMQRADLHAALARRLPSEIVRTSAECVSVRQAEGGVTVTLAGGSTVSGALLIGADGLHSVVRASLWGTGRLRYSGQTCYRGIAHLQLSDPHVLREVQGSGKRAAVCPLDAGRAYWWAALNAEAGETDDPTARRDRLREHFRGWPFLVPEAIAATEGPILRNDLVDRAPLRRWSRGRISLLGDAAHPMLPNLGQGACTALEDALVLARLLSVHGPTSRALAAYEQERLGRTTRLVRESWAFGVPARWRRPWAVRVREALIRGTPAALFVRTLRRHLDYDAGALPDVA